MKVIKKIAAAILVLVLAMTAIGCHPKNEIAVTIDGYQYTSAYYMCVFLDAYSEALGLASASLTEAEQKTASTEVLISKKIEEKDFNTWTKDRTIELLKEITYYKSMCAKSKVDYTKEERAAIESQTETYWTQEDNYGIKAVDIYEPNGVYLQTYKQYVLDSGYADLYFKHLYGEGGSKEVPVEDLKKEFYANNLLANVLNVDFNNYESDEERDEVKKKFDGYAKKIEKGKMTFEEAFNDHNNIKTEESKEDTKKEETETDSNMPKDSSAILLDSTYDFYEEVKKMKVGDVKVFENEYQTTIHLVVKKDLKADDYYLKANDLTLRQTLKQDEFLTQSSEKAAKLTADINSFAVDRFKVKNIKEPEYEAPIY